MPASQLWHEVLLDAPLHGFQVPGAHLQLSSAAKPSEWYDATGAALVGIVTAHYKKLEEWYVPPDRVVVDFVTIAASYRAPATDWTAPPAS